jgi:CheY-like chemotaxis protein
VLLCEDDDAVRDALSNFLQSNGYSVHEANRAEEALHILDGAADVDLLIVDYSMPGMNGLETIRQARMRRPDLRTLLITGRAGIVSGDDLGMPVLLKPFAPNQLARQVADILAA